jgi:hypothetical protein
MPKLCLCLHASGLTLIATSIIGYRAGAANPADVMLPLYYHFVYWYYCRFFNCWNQAKKLILRVLL